jgi:hypothetical protein
VPPGHGCGGTVVILIADCSFNSQLGDSDVRTLISTILKDLQFSMLLPYSMDPDINPIDAMKPDFAKLISDQDMDTKAVVLKRIMLLLALCFACSAIIFSFFDGAVQVYLILTALYLGNYLICLFVPNMVLAFVCLFTLAGSVWLQFQYSEAVVYDVLLAGPVLLLLVYAAIRSSSAET